jgi:hypothetical protein
LFQIVFTIPHGTGNDVEKRALLLIFAALSATSDA